MGCLTRFRKFQNATGIINSSFMTNGHTAALERHGCVTGWRNGSMKAAQNVRVAGQGRKTPWHPIATVPALPQAAT